MQQARVLLFSNSFYCFFFLFFSSSLSETAPSVFNFPQSQDMGKKDSFILFITKSSRLSHQIRWHHCIYYSIKSNSDIYFLASGREVQLAEHVSSPCLLATYEEIAKVMSQRCLKCTR